MSNIGQIKVQLGVETIEEMAERLGVELIVLPLNGYKERKNTLHEHYRKAYREAFGAHIGQVIADCKDHVEGYDEKLVRPSYISLEFGEEWNDGDGSDLRLQYLELLDENGVRVCGDCPVEYTMVGRNSFKPYTRIYELEELLQDIVYEYNNEELDLMLGETTKIIYPQVEDKPKGDE